MTDKPVIVDGIYVEGCGHYWNGRCHAYVDSTGKFLLCINSPNCYYKQLKRAENQIVDLNKMVDIKEQECDQLKAELEQEKALKETYLTCYKAKHEDIDGELFKLKQTLTEIKEVAKQMNNECFYNDFSCDGCEVENAVASSYYDKSERKEINGNG